MHGLIAFNEYVRFEGFSKKDEDTLIQRLKESGIVAKQDSHLVFERVWIDPSRWPKEISADAEWRNALSWSK